MPFASSGSVSVGSFILSSRIPFKWMIRRPLIIVYYHTLSRWYIIVRQQRSDLQYESNSYLRCCAQCHVRPSIHFLLAHHQLPNVHPRLHSLISLNPSWALDPIRAYEEYSEIYIPITFSMSYAMSFACVMSTLVHTLYVPYLTLEPRLLDLGKGERGSAMKT